MVSGRKGCQHTFSVRKDVTGYGRELEGTLGWGWYIYVVLFAAGSLVVFKCFWIQRGVYERSAVKSQRYDTQFRYCNNNRRWLRFVDPSAGQDYSSETLTLPSLGSDL